MLGLVEGGFHAVQYSGIPPTLWSDLADPQLVQRNCGRGGETALIIIDVR